MNIDAKVRKAVRKFSVKYGNPTPEQLIAYRIQESLDQGTLVLDIPEQGYPWSIKELKRGLNDYYCNGREAQFSTDRMGLQGIPWVFSRRIGAGEGIRSFRNHLWCCGSSAGS